MGYILPIQNYQATQYANRMSMGEYNFAHVGAIRPVKMKSLFEEELEQELYSEQQERRDASSDEDHDEFVQPYPYKKMIYPNPATLSPEISKVNGKGLQINTYA